MNHTYKRVWLLTALAGALAAAPGVALAQSNTSGVAVPPVPKFNTKDAAGYGKALAYYMDKRDSGWRDYYAKAGMTLIDSRGDKVNREVMVMILEQTDGNKTIAKFQTPADIRGIAALIHEHPGSTDDTWLYLPASRRTRRISGANRTASFQGTEFTYEDLAQFTVENYTWKFLAETTVGKSPVFKLEAKPNYKDTGYSRLHVYVNKEHWRIEKVEFFDKAQKLLKTLNYANWKLFHGRFWRGQLFTMINHQTRKTTRVEAQSMYVNLALYKRKDGSKRDNLASEQFTKRALETNR